MTNKSSCFSSKKLFIYPNNRLPIPLIIIVLMSFVVLMQSSCDNKGNKQRLNNIVKPEEAKFVERQSCIECHEEQYSEWKDSHHDLETNTFKTTWSEIDVGC